MKPAVLATNEAQSVEDTDWIVCCTAQFQLQVDIGKFVHSANTDWHITYVDLHLACWKASSCTKLPCRQNHLTAFTCGGICKSEISCGGMQVCFRLVEDECQKNVAAGFSVVSEWRA
jgi:hypothetical protein